MGVSIFQVELGQCLARYVEDSMAKRSQQEKLYRIIGRLTRKFKPDDILHEMSVRYEEYSIGAGSEAEVEFWLKCSRATGNLSSGTEKWLDEMVEEGQEEDGT
jgi:hypothetical protein